MWNSLGLWQSIEHTSETGQANAQETNNPGGSELSTLCRSHGEYSDTAPAVRPSTKLKDPSRQAWPHSFGISHRQTTYTPSFQHPSISFSRRHHGCPTLIW